ncbi:MAG TPA: response regulator [bacterium]
MTKVLVADDDPDLRDILRAILESAGFSVVEAADGQAAVEEIRTHQPALVILDNMMPRMTGPQVCTWLKQDMLLRHVPVIMLTGKSEVQDKVEGINAGADDYLVKPFEPKELLARVQMVIRRSAQDLEANPLTRLPGNTSIHREIQQSITSRTPFAVCYVDLDQFKAFNDHYGYSRGDEAIRYTAQALLQASKTAGGPSDFVGHIGGDDFILITSPDRAEAVCRTIVESFDAGVGTLYDEADRQRGHLLHRTRTGEMVEVPFLFISIALVSSEDHQFEHPGQIAELGAELKTYAKQFQKSLYVRDRRQMPARPGEPAPPAAG